MSDARLSTLRRAALTGDHGARVAWLTEWLRGDPACSACGGQGCACCDEPGETVCPMSTCSICHGTGTQRRSRVELAAYCFDPAAADVLRYSRSPWLDAKTYQPIATRPSRSRTGLVAFPAGDGLPAYVRPWRLRWRPSRCGRQTCRPTASTAVLMAKPSTASLTRHQGALSRPPKPGSPAPARSTCAQPTQQHIPSTAAPTLKERQAETSQGLGDPTKTSSCTARSSAPLGWPPSPASALPSALLSWTTL